MPDSVKVFVPDCEKLSVTCAVVATFAAAAAAALHNLHLAVYPLLLTVGYIWLCSSSINLSVASSALFFTALQAQV